MDFMHREIAIWNSLKVKLKGIRASEKKIPDYFSAKGRIIPLIRKHPTTDTSVTTSSASYWQHIQLRDMTDYTFPLSSQLLTNFLAQIRDLLLHIHLWKFHKRLFIFMQIQSIMCLQLFNLVLYNRTKESCFICIAVQDNAGLHV